MSRATDRRATTRILLIDAAAGILVAVAFLLVVAAASVYRGSSPEGAVGRWSIVALLLAGVAALVAHWWRGWRRASPVAWTTPDPPRPYVVRTIRAGSEERAERELAVQVPEMARAGYVLATKSWNGGRTSAIAVLFLGWLGFLFGDDGTLTVTWAYRPDLTGPPTRVLRFRSS